MLSCFSTLVMASLSITAAQGHGNTPPPELDGLSFLVGSWSGKQNFNNPGTPLVGDITLSVHKFAGRYLEEILSTTLPGRAPTEVHHMISFDAKSKKFRAWWFNDTSSTPSEFEGALSGKQLIFVSQSANPNAPTLRATYELTADTTMTYKLEMKTGGGWQELFHSAYAKQP